MKKLNQEDFDDLLHDLVQEAMSVTSHDHDHTDPVNEQGAAYMAYDLRERFRIALERLGI